MKTVVITGVSSGIGYATAADLIDHDYTVFGSVRRQEDARRVKGELGERFRPLLFDVTDQAGVEAAVSPVQDAVGEAGLTGLINNAGIVEPGPLMHMPLERFRRQLDVNVSGVLAVTQAFLPLLGARKNARHVPGRIINVSSISGRIAYPFMGAYAASKHALEAISDALRRELMLYGIDVILIEPGTVRTPIQDKFAAQVRRYAQTDYGALFGALEKEMAEREETGLPVAVVCRAIRQALESDRPQTRYLIPRKWLTGWFLPRWLPDRWLDRILARRLGLHP